MKIIFLDVDGVINSNFFMVDIYNKKAEKYKDKYIDFKKLEYIKQIVDRTGAKIVLTSTWRKLKEDTDVLKEAFDIVDLEIFSMTPILNGYRGTEIKAWLDEYSDKYDIENFIIIDDNSDMEPFKDKLYKTCHITGLLKADIDKIVEQLTGSITY